MTTREYGGEDRTVTGLTILAQSLKTHAVFAADGEIQVDLDSDSLERFHTSYALLKKEGYLAGSSARAWRSRSGNWHIVVTLGNGDLHTARNRITFALMLGSDPTREILNMSEDRAGTGTIVLFRPNGAVVYDVEGIRRSYEERAAARRATQEYI